MSPIEAQTRADPGGRPQHCTLTLLLLTHGATAKSDRLHLHIGARQLLAAGSCQQMIDG